MIRQAVFWVQLVVVFGLTRYGWVVRCTAAGERYYYNVESGETAATEGAWEKRDPGNGRVYWRNKVRVHPGDKTGHIYVCRHVCSVQ